VSKSEFRRAVDLRARKLNVVPEKGEDLPVAKTSAVSTNGLAGGLTMLRKAIVLAALTAAAGGCASVGAPEKEGQLAAAGFVRLQADTPQRIAKLQALPQNTIIYAQRKKGNAYIYADAAGCNCAYVGNEAAYQRYQQIRAANNIAQMQETTALLNAEAADDWGGAWGPMVPYWY
jgi:hypothetical protein